MVKFGKFLKSVKRPKWSGHYFNYKLFRTLLRAVTVDQEIQSKFFHHFDNEVEKIAQFLWSTAIESKTALARLSSQLVIPVETMLISGDLRAVTMYAYQVVTLAKEVRELAMFMDVNLVALHKVLKKYNKKSSSLTANEYVQVRRTQVDSQFNKLWNTQAIESFASDLGEIASKLTRPLDSDGPHPSELLLEHSEMIEILGEQIDDTVAKGTPHSVHTNMPLERYMNPVVGNTGSFDASGLHLSGSDRVAVGMLAAYCVNYNVAYTEGRAYCQELGFPDMLLGAIFSTTPFFALIVAICHGYMRNVDYKLPLIYSILMCIIGNALYGLGSHADSAFFLVIGRAFFGLGDPTLLLLFYFAGTVGRPIKRHWHISLLGLILASYTLSWILQGILKSINATGQFGSYNVGTLGFAVGWTVALVPFTTYFKTPMSAAPRYSNDVRPSSEKLQMVLISLLALFLPSAMSESYTLGLIAVSSSEWLPILLAASTLLAFLSLSRIPTITVSRRVLVLLEATILGTVLCLKMVEHHSGTDIRSIAIFPQFLLQVFLGLGFATIIRRVKKQAGKAIKRNMLQAGYIVILAGRVAGGMISTVASFGGEEKLIGNLMIAVGVECAGLTVATVFFW